MIEVTLIYPDGSTWFAGQLKTQEHVDKWVEKTKTEPGFKEGTQIQINDRTAEIAAQIAAASAKFEAENAKNKLLRSELKELKKTKPKFGKELDEILDKILEIVVPG